MRYDLRLQPRLELAQKLTPQLILNIELLQVASLDLEQLVRKELEENPALEADEGQPEELESVASEIPSELPVTEGVDGGSAAEVPLGNDGTVPSGGESVGELNVEDFFPLDQYAPGPAPVRADQGEVDAIDLAAAPAPGLREALMPGLRAVLSEGDARIAEMVLESLDDDGFLTTPEEELVESWGVGPSRLRDILYVIQRVEPGGIACRSQQESFLVQLELHGHPPDSLESRIVAQHWELLLQQNVAKIKKLCCADDDELKHALAAIVTLEPRPARRFRSEQIEYVTPDFWVEHREGRHVAVANETTIPRLRLAKRYVEILQNPKAFPREQVKFAREKFNRAVMFLRGIESRRRTLQRLMELIIEEQQEFFRNGPQHLKPATLRAAAERLGVHASTASRATHGKYVETDYGIFPLKYFFKAGTGDSSRESIKEMVRSIVDKEAKDHPLSDDVIAKMLGQQNVKVSRRTVAKYRDELGIPGSSQRGKI